MNFGSGLATGQRIDVEEPMRPRRVLMPLAAVSMMMGPLKATTVQLSSAALLIAAVGPAAAMPVATTAFYRASLGDFPNADPFIVYPCYGPGHCNFTLQTS